MSNGVISFIKPPGLTSHDIVAIVRRKLRIKRVGHTGTLDPMAAGVLPICIGKGTKIVDFLMNDKKVYRAELTLGTMTDTQDRWGEALESSDKVVSEDEIRIEMAKFIGEIAQVPPMYSALKHNGKKLYELAREGITVERKERIRTIYSLDIISVNDNKVIFDVSCSKGTYIRTLCHDIGLNLGTFGHMSFLLRKSTGNFNLNNSITIEEFENLPNETIHDMIIPVDKALLDFRKIEVVSEIKFQVFNGIKMNLVKFATHTFDTSELKDKDYILTYCENVFCGISIYKKSTDEIIMDKLFYTGD